MGTKKTYTCDCRAQYEIDFKYEGPIRYEVYKCPQCGDVILTLDQVKAHKKAVELNRIAKQLKRPILRKVGNSVVVTMPKEVVNLGFEEGCEVQIEILDQGHISLKINDRKKSRRAATG